MVMECGFLSVFSTHMGLWQMSQGRGSRLQGPRFPDSLSFQLCGILHFFVRLSVFLIAFIPSNNLYTSLLTSALLSDSPTARQSPVLSSYEPALQFFQINKFLSGRFQDNLPFQPLYLAQFFQPFRVSLVILLNLSLCW